MESELYCETVIMLLGTIGVLCCILSTVAAAIYINIYAGLIGMLFYAGIMCLIAVEIREIRRDF